MATRTIEKMISDEKERIMTSLNLIPSENLPSKKVREILGSVLTSKYCEGYPGKRYYPGNKIYDEIEIECQKEALKTFRLNEKDWGVNVQSYSGSPANLAIYLGLIEPGDKIMGMALSSGGHLTHGYKTSYTGKIFNSYQYKVEEDGLIDYDLLEKFAIVVKPKILISGLTSYPRFLNYDSFCRISRIVGAYHVADVSHIAGLIASDLFVSPFPYSDVVMMTTHKTLRGPRGALIFYRKELEDKINKSIFPGLQGGPHMNNIAGILQCLKEAQTVKFKKYQYDILVNSSELSDCLKSKGLKLYTGGTDNHLMLIDLKQIGISGVIAEKLLEANNIIANRNSLPFDQSPFSPTGIRLGTPFITTLGLKKKHMKEVADLIYNALIGKNVKNKVIRFCKENYNENII